MKIYLELTNNLEASGMSCGSSSFSERVGSDVCFTTTPGSLECRKAEESCARPRNMHFHFTSMIY